MGGKKLHYACDDCQKVSDKVKIHKENLTEDSLAHSVKRFGYQCVMCDSVEVYRVWI